ncbi:MAG: hypothetical protein KAS32_00290 [Candidatus Peribacteraceae bacterium]|nr:hypothetical protein [Candidatus Peribacteraceae bacterium]
MEIKRDDISINITIEWIRLQNNFGEPYCWGNKKGTNNDLNWNKSHVIYRWVQSSNDSIAVVGETNRTISERTNNYISAKPGSQAGSTNKKVYAENDRLISNGDNLYLEITVSVTGYDLHSDKERKQAEALLIEYYKPYL